MHSGGLSEDSVRTQLERILSSPGFVRNERLSRFLRFVVEQQLAGKAAEIKESLVGVEVFGRSPDYDTRQDSVVRTEAAKLRTRLANYYAGDRAADPVVIELPKGGYAPAFREAPVRTEPPATVRRPRLVAASVVLILAAMLGAWWMRPHHATASMAVLPLNNLSENAADYFADGLTAEIIRNLSIIEGLTVRSQTSSFAFKGKPRNVRDAGRQLGVDYILEGSVLRSGLHLRINVQLVRARDDLPLWSGRFDREVADALVIQDEISRGIVNSLRLKFWPGRRHYETSVEAYDLYLRARAVPVQHGLLAYDQSIALFRNVIAKDPSFVPAYSGLAEAHAFRSGQFRFDIAAEVESMRRAAEKAIELDPLSAEARDVMAIAQARNAEWAQSERSFRRALELDPGRSPTNSHYAFFLLVPLGRTDEALRQFRIALRNDPLSPMLQYWLARLLGSLGRYDEAARYFEKLPPDYTDRSTYLAEARFGQGRTTEAIRILETAFDRQNKGTPVRGVLGCTYARVGRRQEAEELAAGSSFNPLNQGQIFACLGDKDRALEALDRAAVAGPVRMSWVLTSHEFALLRGDRRLKALRKRLGLPE